MSSSKKRMADYSWHNKLIKREMTGHRIDHDYASPIWESSHCLYQKDLLGHFNCVQAAEFSNDGQFLASGINNELIDIQLSKFLTTIFNFFPHIIGGGDRRVLLWKTADIFDSQLRSSPETMNDNGLHDDQIFCMAFSNNGETLLSAGASSTIILHDTET